MSDKITLDQIRQQQQRVADLAYKKKVANDEYYRLSRLKNEASTAQDHATEEYERALEGLTTMGRRFALDLSETSVTPQTPETNNE